MSTKQKSKQFFRKENKNIRKQILNAVSKNWRPAGKKEAANWKNNEDYSEIQDVLKELNEAQKSLLSTKKEEEDLLAFGGFPRFEGENLKKTIFGEKLVKIFWMGLRENDWKNFSLQGPMVPWVERLSMR